MNTEYRWFSPSRRVPMATLALLIVFVMFLLLSTGVIELNMAISWSSMPSFAAPVVDDFEFVLKRAHLMADFALSAPQAMAFWGVELMCLGVALTLPLLRMLIGTLVVVSALAAVTLLELAIGPGMFEAGRATLLCLYFVYVLFQFFAELSDKYTITRVFAQFVPPELVRQYTLDPDSLRLDSEARQITVLFVDILGFATVSERLSPHLLARWLDAYFEAVSGVIVRYSGTVDKYMGDSVMALWGAPQVDGQHAERALEAGIAIEQRLAELNIELRKSHLPEMRIGVGISTGVCHVGVMGSSFRRSYTVVGDTVNIAQRLEKLTREYSVPVVVSETTARLARGWLYRELGTEYVKGRKRFVNIVQPIGRESEIDDARRQQISLHNAAVRAMQQQQFFKARSVFEKLKEETGEHDLYTLLLARLQLLKRRRPEPDMVVPERGDEGPDQEEAS